MLYERRSSKITVLGSYLESQALTSQRGCYRTGLPNWTHGLGDAA